MYKLLAIILALVPAYLIRFKILGLPTTLLEVLVVGFLLVAFIPVVSRFIGSKKADKSADYKKIKNLGKINWAIGLFALAGIISTAVSPEPVRALGQLRAFIFEPILLFYAIILSVKDDQNLLPAIRTLFWAAIAISLFGLFQHYSFIFLPIRFWGNGEEMQRIVSIFEYPNALSLYLGPLLGFFSMLWLNNYSLTKNRWVALGGLVVMGVALMLTFSRGAWIATLIGLTVAGILKFGAKKIFVPALAIILLTLFIPSVRERLSLGVSDASSSAHFELLKIGANKVLDNPIFGNGLYGFRATQQEANYAGEILNYPHNFILNFWLELGLLGLVGFGWILYLLFIKIKNQPGIFGLACGIYILIALIHGLVDVPYFKNDLSLLFWFMASLLFLRK